MEIFRHKNRNGYLAHQSRMADVFNERQKHLEKKLHNLVAKKSDAIKGFSYPAKQEVDFQVHFNPNDLAATNWRETLICPHTHLNNRLRACLEIIDCELELYQDSPIYISEAVTPLFQYLDKRYTNIIGSEYISPNLKSGETKKGIRHESLTDLSFQDNSFDAFMSFECLEHIPDYKKCLSESYRTLKDGGSFFFSVPFRWDLEETLVRAKINAAGEIEHILEPEYHGDPMQDQGCLCFYHFGWDILKLCEQAGFKDAYCISTWSDYNCNLGNDLLFFIAKK